MSYKTNPISNRLKIIKGWKNPYLPTKTLNYSRDISLWFKVYLLLKTFLNLKKIQLLSCEIRFEQQNKKIIFLVINKKKTQRKKKKKTKLSLKKLKTPIRKIVNRNAVFFLYNNLTFLKKISFWGQNVLHKKILSKFWLTKPKSSTWINHFEKIIKIRQISKNKISYLKKNKIFIPAEHLKIQFYTKKQKQLLAQKLKIHKKNSIFFTKLLELSQQKESQFLKKLIQNLKTRIIKNQEEIKKINTLYEILFRLNKTNLIKKKNIFFKKLMRNRLQKNKLNILQKYWKKEFTSLNRTKFLKQRLPIFLLKIHQSLFSSGLNAKTIFFNKSFLSKKMLHLNFLSSQIQNKNYLKKNSFLIHNLRAKSERKKKQTEKILTKLHSKFFLKSKFVHVMKKKQLPYAYYKIVLWFLLRLKKKRKKKISYTLKKISKNLNFKRKKQYLQKQISFWNEKKYKNIHIQQRFAKDIKKINNIVKKNQIAKTYQYRLPYRKSYFKFLQLTTKLKLKYLIQDFVQKYFNLQVEAKIVHFLNEQKNQNYFRLVFPVWKKKKNQLFRKFRQGTWKQKSIFLTSQLKIGTTTKKTNSQLTKSISKELKKKDLFVLTRKKIKSLRIKNSFKRIKNSKDFRHSFKYFIPTLMHFSRTLNPQPLTDLFAKVLYKAKKQTWMINTIKDILKMLKLGKNVGYKIALAGRINSADKSRLVYITRKNVPLQVFDKNMNFAYSQAKARIGVFGIKIWVYF